MKPRLKHTEQGWYGYVQAGDYYKQIWGVATAEHAYNILKNFQTEHQPPTEQEYIEFFHNRLDEARIK